MKNLFIILLAALTVFLTAPKGSFAQGMMGGYYGQPTPAQSDLQEEQSMQNAGQKIYQNLQEKKLTCQNLTHDDFEKLGEYFMGQTAGSTQNHVYWDQRIQAMMGENGDTQMHVVWGQRGSGCLTNATLPLNTPSFIRGMIGNQSGAEGGGFSMIGWGGYGWNGMMNGNLGWGFGVVHIIFGLVILIDLILAGVWFWQQIRSPKRSK